MKKAFKQNFPMKLPKYRYVAALLKMAFQKVDGSGGK